MVPDAPSYGYPPTLPTLPPDTRQPARLIRDKLLTRNNLRRGVEINGASCPFCRSHEEDASHLFFGCDKILPLWWESMSWVNIVGVFFG